MARRLLPGVLALAAVLADAQGSHDLSRDALLAALPFAAVGALVSFGDFVEAKRPGAGVQAFLSGVIVALLVLSCAVRSNAVHGVPPLATSSLLAVLAVVALKAALAGVPHVRRLGSFSPAKP